MAEFPELVMAVGNPLADPESIARRLSLIDEAKSWPGGASTEAKLFHIVASFPPAYGLDEPFTIRMGKPGKEFDREGPLHNPFDMTPSVFKGETDLRIRPTFKKLYIPLELMAREDPGGAEIVGALLVRAAFMLDHSETKPGIWRYQPSEAAVRYVEARTNRSSRIAIPRNAPSTRSHRTQRRCEVCGSGLRRGFWSRTPQQLAHIGPSCGDLPRKVIQCVVRGRPAATPGDDCPPPSQRVLSRVPSPQERLHFSAAASLASAERTGPTSLTRPTTKALPIMKARFASGIPVFVQSSGKPLRRSSSIGVSRR